MESVNFNNLFAVRQMLCAILSPVSYKATCKKKFEGPFKGKGSGHPLPDAAEGPFLLIKDCSFILAWLTHTHQKLK